MRCADCGQQSWRKRSIGPHYRQLPPPAVPIIKEVRIHAQVRSTAGAKRDRNRPGHFESTCSYAQPREAGTLSMLQSHFLLASGAVHAEIDPEMLPPQVRRDIAQMDEVELFRTLAGVV